MDVDEARRCREDIERLIVAQNVDLPICPYDNEPCFNMERGCSVFAFGSFTKDGKEEVVWSCPRLKKVSF